MKTYKAEISVFEELLEDAVFDPGWWLKIKLYFLGIPFRWMGYRETRADVITGYEYKDTHYILDYRMESLPFEEEIRRMTATNVELSRLSKIYDLDFNHQHINDYLNSN